MENTISEINFINLILIDLHRNDFIYEFTTFRITLATIFIYVNIRLAATVIMKLYK